MWWRKKPDNLDNKYVVEKANAERNLAMARILRERSEVVMRDALGNSDPLGTEIQIAMERRRS